MKERERMGGGVRNREKYWRERCDERDKATVKQFKEENKKREKERATGRSQTV